MGRKIIINLLIIFIHFLIGINVEKYSEMKFNELKVKDKILRIYFWTLIITVAILLFIEFIKYSLSVFVN